MNRIHLIQPMGGQGTRFSKKGYELPKPMLELQGKPFFYWSIRSVIRSMDIEDLICVVLKEHEERFHIVESIHSFFPNARIKVIDHVLNGAVFTCEEGLTYVDDDLPVLFNDCDHVFSSSEFTAYCNSMKGSSSQTLPIFDGALLTFSSDDPAYSYVRFDTGDRVIGTVEKEVVSNKAICGAYYFRNKNIFLTSMESYLMECEYEELFISGLYNEMIRQGKEVGVFSLDEHISYGTPQELKQAESDERLWRYLE